MNDVLAKTSVLLGVFTLLPSLVSADTIVLNNGRRVEGCTIAAARWDQVQYKTSENNPVQNVDAGRVASLQRDSSSRDLTQGHKLFASGKYAAAAKRFDSAAKGVVDWEKAEGGYFLAKAYAAGGAGKRAEAAFKDYIKGNEGAKDWWVPHALYDLGSLQASRKRYKAAAQSFSRLQEFGDVWSGRARLGTALIVIQKKDSGKYQKAQQDLSRLTKNRNTPTADKAEAFLLRAELFMLGEQYPRAMTELRSEFFNAAKTRENYYTSHRARATLQMGLLLAAQGGKENLERAEIWLLKVPALYRNEGEVYRRACEALAQLYTDLDNSERANEWKRRGEDAS